MDDQELARILTTIFDRLESLAAQNEEAAITISAIRGALMNTSSGSLAFHKEYEKLYANFADVAKNRSADAAVEEIRQQLSHLSRPKS